MEAIIDKDLERKLNANFWKARLLIWLACSFLYIPIFVIFLQENGLTLKDVLILKMAMGIAVIIMEIPSGYAADVLGRKNCIATAGIIIASGLLTYSLASSFSGYILAELLIGLGWSLISGADSALIFDTLSALEREEEYLKIESSMIGAAGYAEALGGVLSTGLCLISLRAPFIGQAALFLLYTLIALSLTEPPRAKRKQDKPSLSELIGASKTILIDTPLLRWLTIYNATIGAVSFAIVWLCQPYMKEVGIPIEYFGIAWMVFHLFLGITSGQAYRFEKYLGAHRLLLLLTLLPPIGYLLMAYTESIYGVIFILIFYLGRGLRVPVLKSYINSHIDAELRATMLSTSSFVMAAIFAIFAPFYGWLADTYSIFVCFKVAGLIALILGIGSYWKLYQVMDKIE